MRTTRKSKLLYNGKLVENYQELKEILGDKFSLDSCNIIFGEYKLFPRPIELSLVGVFKRYKEFDCIKDAKEFVKIEKSDLQSYNYLICELKNNKVLFIDLTV